MKQQRIVGAYIKNPVGILQVAKDKVGNRPVRVLKNIQPVLNVAKKVFVNPMNVKRIEKKKKPDSEKLEYGGPKSLDEVRADISRKNPASKMDFGNCLQIGGKQEGENT